eukprot:362388-Chlamydomonas_euryale.AAC.3
MHTARSISPSRRAPATWFWIPRSTCPLEYRAGLCTPLRFCDGQHQRGSAHEWRHAAARPHPGRRRRPTAHRPRSQSSDAGVACAGRAHRVGGRAALRARVRVTCASGGWSCGAEGLHARDVRIGWVVVRH